MVGGLILPVLQHLFQTTLTSLHLQSGSDKQQEIRTDSLHSIDRRPDEEENPRLP